MQYLRSFLIPLIAGTMALSPKAAGQKDKKLDPDEIGNRDVGKGVNLYSLEKEVALGKQLAQEVDREAKLVDHPLPAEFINRLAQNLARNSDVKIPVTVKVIDNAEANAFALPGGRVSFRRGR